MINFSLSKIRRCPADGGAKVASSLFPFPFLLAILIFQLQRPICQAQQQTEEEKKSADGDDLYILLDEISVFSCRGVKNEIKLTEEVPKRANYLCEYYNMFKDVQIVNERGNKVYYIKAPGNYSMHFKRINAGRICGERHEKEGRILLKEQKVMAKQKREKNSLIHPSNQLIYCISPHCHHLILSHPSPNSSVLSLPFLMYSRHPFAILLPWQFFKFLPFVFPKSVQKL
jgi:hypothetical protein